MVAPEAPPVAFAPFRPPRFCNFSRVSVGPGGSFAAWSAETRSIIAPSGPAPSDVLIGQAAAREPFAAAPMFLYSHVENVAPLRWSAATGQLIARVHGDRLIAVDAATGAFVERGTLDRSLRNLDIRVLSDGEVGAFYAPDLLSRTRRITGDFIRGSVTLTSAFSVLAVRRSDLALVRLEAKDEQPLTVNSAVTRSLADPPSDNLSYLGAPLRDDSRFMPYQQPLFDLEDGTFAGKFGPSGIRVMHSRGFREPLAAFASRLVLDGSVVLDASLRHDTLFILLLEGGDRLSLVRIGKRVESRPLCRKSMAALEPSGTARPIPQAERGPIHARFFTLSEDGREGNEAGRPPAILYDQRPSKSARRDDELVIYLHGGPGATLADDFFPTPVLRLLRPGRAVLAIDYSGSLGGGPDLSSRLGWLGVDALRQDMAALDRWLATHRYRKVDLVSASFGAVPAMLATQEFNRRLASRVFIAPLLKLREPEEWAQSGPFGPTDPLTQRAFEIALFGGETKRSKFAADLRAAVANLLPGPADYFYFGGRDGVSRPVDLASPGGASMRIFDGIHHETIFGTPMLWLDILERLDGTPPPRGNAPKGPSHPGASRDP